MNSGNYTISEWLLTSRPGHFGLVAGSAYPTGIILLIILVIMTACSMSFVRRGGCFEVSLLVQFSFLLLSTVILANSDRRFARTTLLGN
jgi:uncharacterized membrane protein